MKSMQRKWRVAIICLIPSLSACDPGVSIYRKGAITKEWQLTCLEDAVRSIGRTETQISEGRDPDQGNGPRMVKKVYISLSSSPHVNLEIWPLKSGGWGFQQWWGELGTNLPPETRVAVLAQFDKQITSIEESCGTKFYVVDTKFDR